VLLTDGTAPGSKMLFECSLHEVRALFDLQAYLKNPQVFKNVAARYQSILLDALYMWLMVNV
jgi:hypothetical protein